METRTRSLLALPLLAALIAGCGKEAHKPHDLPEPSPVQAQTITVNETQAPVTYEASGQVQPLLHALLSSKVMARVDSVKVSEGARVSKGQILASLDSRELASGLDMAQAGYRAAQAGAGTAATAAAMEDRMSDARIGQAEAQAAQARAAVMSAQAALDLALAGPRTQQKAQAQLAVDQAKSSLTLAETELGRVRRLVADGAMAPRQQDLAQNAYDLAKGQYEQALQALSIAREGSREQEVRAAREALRQAQAGVRQAEAGIAQARAASMQKGLRRQEEAAARANAAQSAAAVRNARVLLAYSTISAPFDGTIVKRMADPGVLASPGLPLLEIEGGGLRLEALLPESALSAIAVGRTAQVELDAVSQSSFPARIAEIVPRGDASTHSFLVKFALPSDSRVKSGMFGRARVQTGTARKILIPSSDTWEKEGLDYVYAVSSGDVIRLRVVTLGRTFGDKVEVLSGLNSGERIITGSRQGISDGARLTGEKK